MILDLTYALEVRRSYSSNSRTQEVDAAYFYKNKAVKKLEYEPADIPKLPIKQKYSPSPGDVLYIGPGCNIPRIKLRDLLLNNHAKTTNDVTKATHIFVDTTFQKMVKSTWLHTINKKQLIQFVELLTEDYLEPNEVEDVKDVIKDLPNDEQINVDNGVKYQIENRSCNLFNGVNKVIPNPNSRSSYMNYVDPDYEDKWQHIMSNLDKVYDYKCLISHINAEDSITITEKVFQQLSSMFESEDKDNHILAMEIMANSNYIESLMYLEVLFTDYGHRINDCSTKRHVNFKSLVDFLGKNLNYLGSSTSYSIIDSLIEKNVITLDSVKYILNRYSTDFYNSTEHFEVKQVTLSDKLAKILNVNYIKTVKEDYVPEVIEEQIEEKETKPEEFSWVE
jgi:hypothetical protein